MTKLIVADNVDEKKNKLNVDKIVDMQNTIQELDNFKKVLDQSALVSITDKEGTITYANDQFCEISKYPREELIGQNHRILKSGHHPPEFFDGLWKTISSGKVWKAEIKNRAKDGSYYWVKTVIVPFIGKDGKPEQYIAARIDISKRKGIEEKLNQALGELKTIDLKKGEFSSMMSHELKTPLAPIIGWCDALQKPEILGKLNADQTTAIKSIFDNAMRLEKLIDDLLDAQKLDMGKMRFEKKYLEVDEMMNDLAMSYKHVVKEKQISLVNSTNEKIKLNSDRKRIDGVLANLICNAIDFVPKDHGRIEINAKNQGDSVLFSVKDNGKGIAKADLDSLFKKFYQVDTSLRRKHGGTGLGLAICKGITDLLGGKIWVESKVGAGATFYFTIPKGGDRD